MKRLLTILCAASMWIGAAAVEAHASILFKYGADGDWTLGAGWGTDAQEKFNQSPTPTLLGATFTTAAINGSYATLAPTQSWTEKFGTVTFTEPDGENGILQPPPGTANETDDLDVSAVLMFLNPTGVGSVVRIAGVIATPGPTVDAGVDLSITFDALPLISFGSGGSFRIELGVLNTDNSIGAITFTQTGQAKDVYVRVTLLQEPTNGGGQGGGVVPEPTSMALAGFAGIGMALGAIRRRRQSKAEAA